jgi:hypothetical protein
MLCGNLFRLSLVLCTAFVTSGMLLFAGIYAPGPACNDSCKVRYYFRTGTFYQEITDGTCNFCVTFGCTGSGSEASNCVEHSYQSAVKTYDDGTSACTDSEDPGSYECTAVFGTLINNSLTPVFRCYPESP